MKTKLAALLTVAMAFGFAAPSFAEDSDNLTKVVDGSLMVTRVGGVGAGVVIGTPVAIVRQTLKHYTTWTPDLADKVGGHECGPSMALVSLATVPASMVWGTMTGAFIGTKNGVTKGFNTPFHPDSFNLNKEYEE